MLDLLDCRLLRFHFLVRFTKGWRPHVMQIQCLHGWSNTNPYGFQWKVIRFSSELQHTLSSLFIFLLICILWSITCSIQRRHFHSCFRGRCRHEQEFFSLCRIALCSLWAKSSLKNHLTLTGQVWDTLYEDSKLRSDSSLSLLWLLNSFG